MFDPKTPGLVHFEDIEIGRPMTFGAFVVTADDIKRFARAWDPQPMHLDEEAAKATIVGGLCASGFHTCCIMMRMLVDHFLSRTASLGAPGLEEVKWLKPVRPGDVLSIRIHAESKRVMASRPHVGFALAVYDVLNQHGEAVLSSSCNQMIRVRQPAAAGASSGPREPKPVLPDLWASPTADRAAMTLTYFDERPLGETWDLGAHTFGRDEVMDFARTWDPQPFHLDEAAAKASLFGGLAASGWHTACHFIRLIVADRQRIEAETRARGLPIPAHGPSPGFRNLRWIKPVMVGDTVHYRTQTSGKIPLRSRPDRGILQSVAQGRNQKGELVFHYEGMIFVERRPGADRTPAA